MAKCSKCEDVLSSKEASTGKGKCVTCLLRGYQFALGKAYGESEELRQQIAWLTIQNPGKGAMIGAGEKKNKKPPVEAPTKKKVAPIVIPVTKKVAPKRTAPVVKKVKKRK